MIHYPTCNRIIDHDLSNKTVDQFAPSIATQKGTDTNSSAPLSNYVPHNVSTLARIFENMPGLDRYVFESLFKTLKLVFLVDAKSSHISSLADKDHLDPAWERAVTIMSQSATCKDLESGSNSHLTVGLRIRLRRVADENQLLLWQPGLDLLHTVRLVLLGSHSER
jgi:hypothetical protein